MNVQVSILSDSPSDCESLQSGQTNRKFLQLTCSAAYMNKSKHISVSDDDDDDDHMVFASVFSILPVGGVGEAASSGQSYSGGIR